MRAVIPTLGVSPYLKDLREVLMAADVQTTLVLNNPGLIPAYECSIKDKTLMFVQPGQSIYQTWNQAIEEATTAGDFLLILNDDIVLTAEAINDMHEELKNQDFAILGFDYNQRSYHQCREVSGSYRTGGLGGFAFAVIPWMIGFVNERFQFWGGDDFLVWQTRRDGQRVGVYDGCHVHHPQPSWSQHHFGHLLPLDWWEHDRELLKELTGESW